MDYRKLRALFRFYVLSDRDNLLGQLQTLITSQQTNLRDQVATFDRQVTSLALSYTADKISYYQGDFDVLKVGLKRVHDGAKSIDRMLSAGVNKNNRIVNGHYFDSIRNKRIILFE
jgi:hypothetical protein